jgi:hypothetical protein
VIVLLGLFMGAVLGLTGAGGSILAVPLLMAGLGWTVLQAEPVALLAVCAAATFGTIAAWDATHVRYRAALVMALAGFVTAPFGLHAARALPLHTLTLLFAAVLGAVALRMAWQAWRAPAEAAVVRAAVAGDALAAQGRWIRLNERGRVIWNASAVAIIAAIGSVTGFLAGLLGVGGGFVIVPSLRAVSELSMHSAIATSLMAIALTSAGAVTASVLQGVEIPWMQALPFVLGALGGMLAGRRLAPRIAGPRLQQGFAVLMLLAALGLGSHALGLV